MPEILYKIPISLWVCGTAQKMKKRRSTDVRVWTREWFETYQDLGGTNRHSGNKGCPRAAASAFGTWAC